ncbi:hypothetical protein Lal_00033408 [Lupinus albus]|nr:hypothetical protein Lal_00033408 [Lupinus albus]
MYQSWKPRLIERFSPERERITWEGEILDYTGGFSPERELSRLGEKWQFWAVDTVPGNRLQSLGNRLQSPGNRLQSPGNRLQSPGNRLHSPGNRLHSPGNRLHSPDPKVGGGVGRTREVAKNRTPILTKVHMAGRERGASQNVPNDLLAHMVAALQQMSENLQYLNRSVAPGPSSHTLVQQGPAEYRGLDKSYRRNPSPFQVGFTPNAAIEWVQGMECTNMKADEVATSESIPHKDFGPQRNFVHGRGKDKMHREERKHYFPRVETGPIKRHCPTSRQSMKAMGTGRPQSIGRVVTMFGAEASESDSLIRCGMYEEREMDVSTARSLSIIKGIVPSWIGDLMPLLPRRQETMVRWLPQVAQGHQVLMIRREYFRLGRVDPNLCAGGGVDVYVLESGCGKWCDIYRRFSLLVVIPNLYYRVDMRDDVPIEFNPGNGLAYQSWKPRLIERFSPERERITWEGEILDYTGGFSPERELSRLGEKWQFWAVDTVPGNRLQSPGNRLHSPGNRLHSPVNRLHSPGNRLHSPGNRLHSPALEFEEKGEKRAFQEQGALGLILELEKRKDPKVGGGVGRTREVAKNRTPILTKVHMAGRERGASQNVPNDLLAHMVAALQQMSENLQHLNRSMAPGPSSHTLVQQGPAEYRGLDKSCRRNLSPFQVGFTPNAAIEWVQGMECTNMKADEVATSESIPHKDFGPQRNFVHGRGKDKMYREELKHYFPRVETGPIKRHCPTSRQSMKAMGTGRPQSIGRVVTMYGAEASESDSLIRCGMYEERGMDVSTASCLSIIKGIVPSWIGDLMPLLPRRQETTYFRLGRVDPNLCAGGGVDVYVLESGCGKWCDIYRRFSLLVVIPNLYYRVDMHDDVPIGFNPGNGLAYQSWKPRLIERFSPERERITWEGEILDYTGGFSPERELSRLGEKWQFWAVDTVPGNRLQSPGNRLQSPGNRLQSPGNRLHSPGNRLHSPALEFEEKGEKRAFQEQGALGLILELEKRKDPKVGGGVGRTREVAKNRTPILTKQYFGSSYVAMLWLKLCSTTLAQVMKQYFGSSYVAMLWLKLCSNTLAQVMKQYFGSSYVAMLWLKLCSKTLAQVM